jgi:hydrogenase maturation protease
VPGAGAPALVLAIGNALRRDDGAAARAARELAAPDLRVREVHQLAPELAEEVALARAVIFADARAAQPAGEVRTVRLAPGAGPASFTHALAPETLLLLAERLYGRAPPAALVTVNAADLGLGDGLSVDVARALPALRAAVLQAARSLAGGQAAARRGLTRRAPR